MTLDATGMFSGFVGGACVWQRDLGLPLSAVAGASTGVLPRIAGELSADGDMLHLWAAGFLAGASPDPAGAYVVRVSVHAPFMPPAPGGGAGGSDEMIGFLCVPRPVALRRLRAQACVCPLRSHGHLVIWVRA